jgi:glutamate-ammonia-ligase adenylyltransferase
MGQTWERAALIKARPVAGDLALGRRFLEAIQPFVWRRHLDFAAIADITAMKRRIDGYKSAGGKKTRLGSQGPAAGRLAGHDLKLGEGGIREVEFCAQTLQLVWGGRMPALRLPATLAALKAEAAHKLLPDGSVVVLEEAYRFLRRAEHRLQMVADRQTHSLPETEAGLARFAAFMGFDGAGAFADTALAHLTRVRGIFTGLFASGPEGETARASGAPSGKSGAAPEASGPGRTPEPGSGLAAPLVAGSGMAEAWLAGRPRAMRTERSRGLLRDMLPAIEAAVARQPDPAGRVHLPAAIGRAGVFVAAPQPRAAGPARRNAGRHAGAGRSPGGVSRFTGGSGVPHAARGCARSRIDGAAAGCGGSGRRNGDREPDGQGRGVRDCGG